VSKHLAPSLILCGRGCSLRRPALFRLEAHNTKISQLNVFILLDLTLNHLKSSVASAMPQKGKHGCAAKAYCRCALLRDARADENVCLYKKLRSVDSPFAFDRDASRASEASEAQLHAMLPGSRFKFASIMSKFLWLKKYSFSGLHHTCLLHLS